MTKPLSSLPVGTLVKDIGTTYNGVPIVWKIADQNHEGYPANSTTLITDKIISLKCFDAMEPSNSDSHRSLNGNSRYIYSNIRQWLNSSAAAGEWYTAQHSADAPPTNANVWNNYNEYDQEAGFLAGFSANMRVALLSTTHTVGKASVDGGGTETCVDKIFFASRAEVVGSGDEVFGNKLAMFSDNASRLAYLTAECASKSEYQGSSVTPSKECNWWTSDALNDNAVGVYFISYNGSGTSWVLSHSGHMGVRPLCNIQSSILVSDTTDSDGAYTIEAFSPGLYIKKNSDWIKVR